MMARSGRSSAVMMTQGAGEIRALLQCAGCVKSAPPPPKAPLTMADIAYVKALFRVRKALVRAKAESHLLAAPDGTIAVGIVDLACVLEQMDRMRDTLALTKSAWREQWYGSPPQRGSSIVTSEGALVAYVGGDEDTHAAVTEIVMAHNVAVSRESTPHD